MDTHSSRVFYVKSEAGLMTDPASRSWVVSRFGAVQRTLDGVELGVITYPRFVLTPENRLQLSYRTGVSGNGTLELAEYDGVWRRQGPQCVTNYVAQRTQFGQAFHAYADAAGVWRKMEIPVPLNATGRSQIVLDRFDNAYVVLPFGRVLDLQLG